MVETVAQPVALPPQEAGAAPPVPGASYPDMAPPPGSIPPGAPAPGVPVPAGAPQPPPTSSGTPGSAAGGAAGAGAQQGGQGSTSLYVGELDPTVTEAMLYEIFSMVGPVASIRVCRDAVTRRSLGYAYVNFMSAQDAERALEQLNYSLIKNRPCRIMWSQRDPSLRKTSTGNIFIKNLDENIDNKALHDTFAAFGNILSCKVALDDTGNSRGYGFVHYDTQDSAEKAIKAVNGMYLNEKVVEVMNHIPRRERQAKIDEIKARFTNLYIKEVSTEVSDEEFKDIFEKYGKVTSTEVKRDDDGSSKGFGFVNFEDHEAARQALEELNGTEYKGKSLFVARFQKKSEREEELRKSYEQQKYEKTLKYQGVNLYVKNLDDDWDNAKLEAEFGQYGTITSTKIVKDDKGNSKGFGFVCFSAPDEASKAVTELNGKMVGSKPLYVSLHQRKDVRKQQLEAQRNNLRNQQLAAAGIPGMPPYMGAPMYYGGMPGGYPPQPGRGGMGMYGGPGMPGQGGMQFPGGPRPRYAPPGQQMPGMPPMYPGGGFGQYPGPPTSQPGGGRGAGGAASRNGPPVNQPGGATRNGPPSANGASAAPPAAGSRGPAPNGVPPAGAGRGAPPAAATPNRSAPGYAVKPGVRNAPSEEAIPGAPAPPTNPTMTALQATLSRANPTEHKQILGETLYPRIQETQPELAGKITGMLLEMENAELVHLLDDETALEAKVREALAVLEEYSKQG